MILFLVFHLMGFFYHTLDKLYRDRHTFNITINSSLTSYASNRWNIQLLWSTTVLTDMSHHFFWMLTICDINSCSMLTNFCSIIIVASSVDYAGHISRLSQSQKKKRSFHWKLHTFEQPPQYYIYKLTHTHIKKHETIEQWANEKLTKRINPIYFLNWTWDEGKISNELFCYESGCRCNFNFSWHT